MKRRALFFLFILLGMSTIAKAQDFALKTNLLSDGFLNINLGAEVALSPKWSLDVEGEFNNWTLTNSRKWKHWAVQPEARFWFCDCFGGHFIGLHAHGGQYNIGGLKNDISFLGTDYSKLSNTRYQGWFVGGGVSYGYAWILGHHWNLEAEVGIGYSYTRYDRFNCAGCGRKIEFDVPHHYVGLTRVAINIVYLF